MPAGHYLERRAGVGLIERASYPSGQRGQTVNLLPSGFVGSNPTLATFVGLHNRWPGQKRGVDGLKELGEAEQRVK